MVLLYATGGLAWSAWGAPFWLLVQFFFTLGVTMFVAAVVVYLRDLQQFLGLITMIWFYSTPILYSMDMLPPKLRLLFWANPFTYFVRIWQGLFLGIPWSFKEMVLAFIFAFFALLLGWGFFQKCRSGFADVL